MAIGVKKNGSLCKKYLKGDIYEIPVDIYNSNKSLIDEVYELLSKGYALSVVKSESGDHVVLKKEGTSGNSKSTEISVDTDFDSYVLSNMCSSLYDEGMQVYSGVNLMVINGDEGYICLTAQMSSDNGKDALFDKLASGKKVYAFLAKDDDIDWENLSEDMEELLGDEMGNLVYLKKSKSTVGVYSSEGSKLLSFKDGDDSYLALFGCVF